MSERYCAACRHRSADFLPGPDGRAQARCPRCQSLERHRFLALLLDVLRPYLATQVSTVLNVAPAPIVPRLLHERYPDIHYIGTDLLDDRHADLLADLTCLPLRSASIDLVWCYHVLEHVPDDAAAIAEIRRVLRPSGLALVQVPRRLAEATDDGPLVPPESPTVRFGQDDHVRWYGYDFEQRLLAGGLVPLVVRPRDVVSGAQIERHRLTAREEVWVCVPRTDGVPIGELDGLLGALLADRARTVREVEGFAGDPGPPVPLQLRLAMAERDRDAARDRASAAERQLLVARRERERVEEQAAVYRRFHDRIKGHPLWRTASTLRTWLPGG